ncbi:MAG: metallophosphoesterase [Clostridiales bacterium]|nr:metallophosphoesterase [Clostridiales bacterium]
MALYAISDLHLSFDQPKAMDVFGAEWRDHHLRIAENWRETVSDADTVLLAGDTSWAMRQRGADADLRFIADLPGKKILVQGNHDYWWDSTARLNATYNDALTFIKNSFAAYDDKTAICGSRGWICPNDKLFTPHDEKIYKREVARLARSLEMASSAGFGEIIVMLHYPPTNDKKEPSGFTELIDQYPVKCVVYGHLHGSACFYAGFMGLRKNARYFLTSCDFLKFCPMKIRAIG